MVLRMMSNSGVLHMMITTFLLRVTTVERGALEMTNTYFLKKTSTTRIHV